MPDDLTAFRAHMARCSAAVIAPMSRPDIRVTIIVRAPEALPSEAMISTNDSLAVVAEAIAHFRGDADPWQPVAAQCDAINTYDLNAHRSFYAMLRRDVPRLAGMIPPEAEAIIQWARARLGGGGQC